MIRRALLALVALTGCAETPPVDAGGKCNADRLGTMTGRVVTPKLKQQALRRSGARTVRVIKPGMMVTMDYRQDRLNIRTDPQNRVTQISCG